MRVTLKLLTLLIATLATFSPLACQEPNAQPKPKLAAPQDPKSAVPVRIKPTDLRTRKHGIDWPSFLGPNRDSKSPEKDITTRWPADGPPIAWQREVGTGYGVGVTSLGRYFQFDRYGDQATLLCLNAETGKEIWRFEYPTEYEDLLGYNNGPRCSPIVDEDRVYILGAEGMLHCLRVLDGQPLWKVDTSAEYGVVQNFFGVGGTPIIEGDLLIANIGGSPPDSPDTYSGRVQGNGSGIVAFNKYTGEEAYKLTDELASYASPIVTSMYDRRWCFVFARGGLVAFEPKSGKLDFEYPWRARSLESVNASTPIVFDNQVFISETYGPGSSLLKITPEGHELVWRDDDRAREKAMQTHWNTPIYLDGYIYGSSGRHTGNAELRCIDAKDGTVKWSEGQLTRSSLLYVDGHFICLSEDGVLRLLRATPEKFDMVAALTLRSPANAVDIRSPEDRQLLAYPAWAAPMLSHGLLYVRGKDRLVVLDLKEGG
jgi:outer membrane protein assembly factor BamB